MRILILNQPFHPDVVATAQIAKDLADALVARGHHVTAIASRSIYGQTGATLPKRETVDGIEIIRVGGARFGKRSTIGRILDFAGYYWRAAVLGLTMKRFDAVVCLTTPPYIALVGLLLKKLRGARLVYWLMDVYPDVMVVHGMLRENGFAHRALRRLHRAVLDRADHTIALGRCMKERLVAQGADPAKIEVVPVWGVSESGPHADTDAARAANAYRREWAVGDRLLVMYSGNFGLAHDVDTFLAADERLKDDDRIRFAFVGGGKRKAAVEAFVRDRALTNCIVAGYQPRERLADLLAAADVHLVSMLPDWSGLVVPSKFYGVAAAGRPTIFIGPESSEIARCIEEWECGVRVAPGDVDSLCEAFQRLAGSPDELAAIARRARAGASSAATRDRCVSRIIALLSPAGSGESDRSAAHAEPNRHGEAIVP